MSHLRSLKPFLDRDGNQVIYAGERLNTGISIRFKGRNNRVVVADPAHIVSLTVTFFGDGATLEILPTSVRRTGLRFTIQMGHESAVRIGENVGSQGKTFITAVQGAQVTIGDDCMIAGGVEIRSDDAHAIYDVRTGERVNPAQSVAIGNHVWLAKHATIMGGVRVGDGAVIGFRSVVTRDVPNNAIAVGAPARVVRRDVAWERPVLKRRLANDMQPRTREGHRPYWNLSRDEPLDWPAPVERPKAWDPKELSELLRTFQEEAKAAQPPLGLYGRARKATGRLARRLHLR